MSMSDDPRPPASGSSPAPASPPAPDPDLGLPNAHAQGGAGLAMAQSEDAYAHLRLDEQGRLLNELPCRGCGYVLRGLEPGDTCPECGEPIAASVRGDLLRFTDPVWLARVRRGLTLMLSCIAVLMLVFFLGLALVAIGLAGSWGRMDMTILRSAINIVIPTLFTLGVWRVTTADPGQTEHERPTAAAKWSRGLISAYLAIAVVIVMVQIYAATPWSGVSLALDGALTAANLIGAALWYGAWVALMIVARRVALRIPSRGMARDSRILKWGMGVAGAVLLTILLISVSLSPNPQRGGVNQPPAPTATASHTRTITQIDPQNPPQNKTETLPDGTTHDVTVMTPSSGSGYTVTEVFTDPRGNTTATTTTTIVSRFDAQGNSNSRTRTTRLSAGSRGNVGLGTILSDPLRAIGWTLQVICSLAVFVFTIWGLVLAWRMRRAIGTAIRQQA